jgi:hypothetical protein
MNEDETPVEDELTQFKNENEILWQKNSVLEDGMKGVLKENALLRVDMNVLKARVAELENTTILKRQEDSLELLQTRLDFKMQEAEDLRKKYEEARQIIDDLEAKIQQYEEKNQAEKTSNQGTEELTLIIDSLQKENENLKAMLKEASKGVSVKKITMEPPEPEAEEQSLDEPADNE